MPLLPTPLRSALPNQLSGLRMALAPVVLAAAFLGTERGFFALLLLALATEIDGTVARRLGAVSERGRRLDSRADLALQGCAIAGFGVLHPDLVRDNLPYLVVAGTALLVPVAYGLALRGEPLGYHSWLARLAGVFVGIALLDFLASGRFMLLRASALLEVLVAVEYLWIAQLLPGYRGDVESLAEAYQIRGERLADG